MSGGTSLDSSVVQRIEGIEKWLSEQPTDVKEEQSHLREGSRERLYWHYGYLMALKDLVRKGAH